MNTASIDLDEEESSIVVDPELAAAHRRERRKVKAERGDQPIDLSSVPEHPVQTANNRLPEHPVQTVESDQPTEEDRAAMLLDAGVSVEDQGRLTALKLRRQAARLADQDRSEQDLSQLHYIA
ncbi:hypothetical protein N0V83_006759, partial [Neocucurbitaria cava]